MLSYRRPHLWINVLLHARAYLLVSGPLAGRGLRLAILSTWLALATWCIAGPSQLGTHRYHRHRCARCPWCVPCRGLRSPIYSSRGAPPDVRRAPYILGDVLQP
ncbi:uncharacterized protein B0H18DRAFT_214302 [Fomitopsis serialis]|uniref:uncharacterized protein n=1 Tax=Fomitopsis serialis TaxID=139415 RepID=UPI002008A028|nr:uncharacterized protein B0H18DRAFT_214302 [Neoantrodia serialis]KAH9913204.1 hypothetical protein B0H18DRAFT_214302 [Neoantrodia serialis]